MYPFVSCLENSSNFAEGQKFRSASFSQVSTFLNLLTQSMRSTLWAYLGSTETGYEKCYFLPYFISSQFNFKTPINFIWLQVSRSSQKQHGYWLSMESSWDLLTRHQLFQKFALQAETYSFNSNQVGYMLFEPGCVVGEQKFCQKNCFSFHSLKKDHYQKEG